MWDTSRLDWYLSRLKSKTRKKGLNNDLWCSIFLRNLPIQYPLLLGIASLCGTISFQNSTASFPRLGPHRPLEGGSSETVSCQWNPLIIYHNLPMTCWCWWVQWWFFKIKWPRTPHFQVNPSASKPAVSSFKHLMFKPFPATPHMFLERHELIQMFRTKILPRHEILHLGILEVAQWPILGWLGVVGAVQSSTT